MERHAKRKTARTSGTIPLPLSALWEGVGGGSLCIRNSHDRLESHGPPPCPLPEYWEWESGRQFLSPQVLPRSANVLHQFLPQHIARKRRRAERQQEHLPR